MSTEVDPTFVEGLTLQQYYFGLVMQGVCSRDKNISLADIQEAYKTATLMVEVESNGNS